MQNKKYYRDPYATGSESFYRLNAFFKHIIATEGVYTMCQKLGAFWLFDAVASHIPGVRNRHPEVYAEGFLVAMLHRNENDDGAALLITDGNDNILASQDIEYTDIPEDVMLFVEFNGQGWTILLPSEH